MSFEHTARTNLESAEIAAAVQGRDNQQRHELTARLDRLPWGRFHTIVTLALSLGWALDAFETNIIGSVLGQVTNVWQLSATQGSALVSSWVLGIFVGAIVFGHWSDRSGRKKMFIFTLVWYAGFSVLTAFSWNFFALLSFRFLAALGVGGEYSAVTAAMVEFIPRKHRGKASALILGAFPVGAILSALLAEYFLNHFAADVGWRLGFGAGAALAVLGLWVRYAIPESPRWLATHGHLEKAEKIVRQVEASLPGAVRKPEGTETDCRRRREESFGAATPPEPTPDVVPYRAYEQSGLGAQAASANPAQPARSQVDNPALDPEPGRESFSRGVKELFSKYFGRLSFACALNFAQASVVYGMLAMLSAIILPAVKVPAQQMPFFYLVGNIGALAGSLLAAGLIDTWGRKGTVTLGYCLMTLGLFYLYFAQTPNTVLLGYTSVMFSLIWGSNTAYIITSEILPMRHRATGLGITVAVGRIGAFCAPLLLSYTYQKTSQPGLALLVLMAMALPGPLAAIIWCFKGTEASNVSLEMLEHK